MNNEILERKKFIESIKNLAEDIGMKGDRFSAEQIFNIADFCENMSIQINKLEIRERIDMDFMNRHLVEHEKLRICVISLKSIIKELDLDKNPQVIKAFQDAGIII
jgi:hypothetical protein